MSDASLVDHAITNVWCSPDQDLQFIFRVARLTVPTGVRGRTALGWGSVTLPTHNDVYHVFQIGQINPKLLGLIPEDRIWYSLSTTMRRERIVIDLYNNDGLQFPRFEAWLCKTEDRNLILAVKDQSKIGQIRTDDVFLRLYSNAFFAADRADDYPHGINSNGTIVTSQAHALSFQRSYHAERIKRGVTLLYRNGRYVSDFLPSQIAIGDYLEYIHDTTIKQVLDFKIKDLFAFTSKLDNKRKWLLHHTQPQVGGEQIDYRDDIDVYLIQESGTSWDGVYYHKNQPDADALRQVTHRDYALCVPYTEAYLDSNPQWQNVDQLTARLFVRHAGYNRPLVHEHNRIKELYKLPDERVVAAMIGSDATVPNWHVVELENSFYTKVMDTPGRELDPKMVKRAYGYNAASKILGETPLYVETKNNRRFVSMPPLLQRNSTVYEYDSNGVLLGNYYHSNGAQYRPMHASTNLVEVIAGRGTRKLDTVFGKVTGKLKPGVNYRFYIATIRRGVLQNDSWRDVTGDERYYQVAGNDYQWLVNPAITATAVKSDDEFLAHELQLGYRNGLMRFSVDAEATYPNGSALGVMYIPPGSLDIWLNKRALIENLDYYVRWPEIVIVNKKYRTTNAMQTIDIRATGFASSDMKMLPPVEHEFVRYGTLSRNGQFNVRDDRVQRVVVDGRVFHRDQLSFSEDNDAAHANVPNGAPYHIRDVVVPVRGPDGESTVDFKAQSEIVDRRVEDYLTRYLGDKEKPAADAIVNRYPVFSPLVSSLLYDLIQDIFPIDKFKGHYSDRDVLLAINGYLWLLDYDPCLKNVNQQYISIHPHDSLHELSVSIYHYRFLERVIKLVLKDRVDLTHHVSINAEWL